MEFAEAKKVNRRGVVMKFQMRKKLTCCNGKFLRRCSCRPGKVFMCTCNTCSPCCYQCCGSQVKTKNS